MVFTITFLLVTIIALLNVAAIWIRSRLKRRYVSQQF
jgi:ABC-type phosphate transport system permease subunit